MVLPAAPIQLSSRDSERPYVPDRELWYAAGLVEPETVAVLVGGDESRLVVFARPRDPVAELWSGPRLGPEGAGERSGADEVYPIGEFTERLPDLIGRGDSVHYRIGRSDDVERTVFGAARRGRARGQRTGGGPRAIVDPGEILDELRLRKSAAEIDAIRHACRITVEGHKSGAAAIAPEVGEWEVEAAVDGAFRAAGAGGPGFETIVGSGPNGCVLHYVANGDRIGSDALVLVDAGAEVGFYNGDVTRTWPASGRFTPAQRAVYEIVEEARRAAIAEAKPGVTIGRVHETASTVIAQGLIDLGVLEGSLSDVLEEARHRAFFPHQTSHWLGLDVHDPGDYARDGASRTLEEGMVFTVEPGIYFGPGALEEGGDDFAGIGVRIEDDVVITRDGAEVLTAGLPTAADDVEAFLGE